MTVAESIEAAVFGMVRDLSVFSEDEKAWPNIAFTPPVIGPYVEIRNLPNGNERMFIRGNDPHRYLGILQLTVVAPLNEGPSIAEALAGQTAEEFPADLVVYSDGIRVQIQKAPDVMGAFRTEVSWNTVVSIRYECLTPPNPSV